MYLDILHKLQKSGVKLLAVSKTKPVNDIRKFYDMGHRDFGENRILELVDKQALLPNDLKWHFIGHLQRNKVKLIVPFVYLIHSVDSLRLAIKINDEAAKINRVVDILIQIDISDEAQKFGWDYDDVISHYETLMQLKHIRIVGFMGMAKNTDNEQEIRREFKLIHEYFEAFKKIINTSYFKELSIGMSSDYHIAVEEGSTIVRIGSLIFGKRE